MGAEIYCPWIATFSRLRDPQQSWRDATELIPDDHVGAVLISGKRRFSDVREVSFARVVSNKNDLRQPRNPQSKRDSHVRVQS
jgi:hypothetical protein